MLEGRKIKKKHHENLHRKYKLNEKGKPRVREILQIIIAKTAKINRHQQRISQFKQNSFLRNDEG